MADCATTVILHRMAAKRCGAEVDSRYKDIGLLHTSTTSSHYLNIHPNISPHKGTSPMAQRLNHIAKHTGRLAGRLASKVTTGLFRRLAHVNDVFFEHVLWNDNFANNLTKYLQHPASCKNN